MLTERTVKLHHVDCSPGAKVGCGWGETYRKGNLALVKILIPKTHVDELQWALANDLHPVVRVCKWQWQIIIEGAEDLVAAWQQGGRKDQCE